MKKLLLFLFAAITIIAACGKELNTYTEAFGADSYAVYETQDGESLGETIILENCALSEKEILQKLGALYHFSSEIEEIRIVYGYTPKLRRITFVDNKPVNFQITVSGDTVTISNPVNLGSF